MIWQGQHRLDVVRSVQARRGVGFGRVRQDWVGQDWVRRATLRYDRVRSGMVGWALVGLGSRRTWFGRARQGRMLHGWQRFGRARLQT